MYTNGVPGSIGEPSVLLVRQSRTYGFASFVLAGYDIDNWNHIVDMFSDMESGEKEVIMSGDFKLIHNRMWCRKDTEKIQKDKRYLRLENKFIEFTSRYSKKKISQLVKETPSPERQWVLPKGGLKHGESELKCALRELAEETSITPSDCGVIYDAQLIEEYYVDIKPYMHKYYTAYQNYNSHTEPFVKESQKTEISDAKWHTIKEIEELGMNILFKERLIKSCKAAIKAFRQSIDIKYYEIYENKDIKEDPKEESDDAW